MSNTKYGNQVQLDSGYNAAINPTPIAIGDNLTTVAAKTMAYLFQLGAGNYIGAWDAATNTPTLLNSTIEAGGNWYNVFISTGDSTATVDFGSGPIVFTAGDAVYSTGAVYAKRDLPGSNIQLPDAQILVGQSNGIAAPKPMTGDVTIIDTGETTLAFNSVTAPTAFNPTVRGSGVQYFNANQSIDISTMVIGRKYKLYNSDTVIRTITFTGTSAAVIGGDALTSGLVQSVNPGTSYNFTLENATTVLID